MTVYFPILQRRITLDSTNNAIRIIENVTQTTVSIAAGTYYLGGSIETGDASDADEGAPLLPAIVTALNSGAGANTYAAAITWSSDPTADQAQVTISRATGTDTFGLRFADALTTFDPGLIGFLESNTANDANDKTSSETPTSVWVADQPHRSLEPELEHEAVVVRTVSGARRSTILGGPYKSRRLEHRLISELRAVGTGGAGGLEVANTGSMLDFVGRVAGDRLIVTLVTLTPPFTLADPGGFTSVDGDGAAVPGNFVIAQESLERFAPSRHSPGLALYDFDLRLDRVAVQ